MQEKLLNFFNSVGFSDEDGDFTEASISKVILKKKDSLFKLNNQKELAKLDLLLKILPKNKIMDRYKIKKKIKMYKNI